MTGQGTTIVIVDSYGSPTIRNDLAVFDRAYQLPAPPAFRIIQPAGWVPAGQDQADSDMVGWASETTLDVEWAHAIAPGAKILLVETPASETEGVHGFPQIVAAEEYVLRHSSVDRDQPELQRHRGNHALGRATPGAARRLPAGRPGSRDRAGRLGQLGATDVGLDETTYYTFPVTSWPDSDPLVTGVGGTELTHRAGYPGGPAVERHQ